MENFNLLAKDYDTEERIERTKSISDEIRLHIVDGKIESVLEYGCGTGLVGFGLIDDVKTLLFVDSSPDMIEQVKQKLIGFGKPADNAICCDFMTAVPENINVDCIIASLVLHHIMDTETILSRLYDVLHSEGRILVVDIDTDDGSFHANRSGFDGHNGFDQSTLIGLAAEAGFRKADIKTFYYGSKIVEGINKPYSLFILDAVK